jgi:hypothetical protein
MLLLGSSLIDGEECSSLLWFREILNDFEEYNYSQRHCKNVFTRKYKINQ